MKQYQRHLRVFASKITDIKNEGGKTFLVLDDNDDDDIEMASDWVEQNAPEVGEYLIRHENGTHTTATDKNFWSTYDRI